MQKKKEKVIIAYFGFVSFSATNDQTRPSKPLEMVKLFIQITEKKNKTKKYQEIV